MTGCCHTNTLRLCGRSMIMMPSCLSVLPCLVASCGCVHLVIYLCPRERGDEKFLQRNAPTVIPTKSHKKGSIVSITGPPFLQTSSPLNLNQSLSKYTIPHKTQWMARKTRDFGSEQDSTAEHERKAPFEDRPRQLVQITPTLPNRRHS